MKNNTLITIIITLLSYLNVYSQVNYLNSIVNDFNFNAQHEVSNNVQYMNPSVTGNLNGNYIVTWYDTRNGNYSIYAQKYSKDCSKVGNNFIVNSNKHLDRNFDPKVAMSLNGNFVIIWLSDSNKIYYQLFDSECKSIGENFLINDSVKTNIVGFSLSMNTFGDFVVVWLEGNHGKFNVYAREFNSEGRPKSSSFLISNRFELLALSDPQVCLSDNGKFLISYLDYAKDIDVILLKLYENNIKLYETSIDLNNSLYSEYKYINISLNTEDEFIITWIDTDISGNHVFMQKINENGLTIGNKIRVSEDIKNKKYYTTIKCDVKNNLTIFWIEKDNSSAQIVGQKYNSDNSKIGSNIILNQYFHSNMKDKFYLSSLSIDSNSTILVWSENLNGFYNIISKRYLFNSLEHDLDENNIPTKYFLSQNYPNPFNPNTKISFGLPKENKVTLTVYNILGEKVIELLDATIGPGYYNIDFYGSNYSSGTYFYSIQTKTFTETKKMLLIK